jgi:hypothetical protein
VTLADCIAEAIAAYGPMPECRLATEVKKRREVVSAELERNPTFIHNGRKARASRWDMREVTGELDDVPTFTVEELATRWEVEHELDVYTATSFVTWWVERGFLEPVDGNGRVRVTELGRLKSEAWNALGVQA